MHCDKIRAILNSSKSLKSIFSKWQILHLRPSGINPLICRTCRISAWYRLCCHWWHLWSHKHMLRDSTVNLEILRGGNCRVFFFFRFCLFFCKNYSHAKIIPICLYEGKRSSIAKITPTWNVLPTFSRNFPRAIITTFTVTLTVYC